VGSSTGSVFQRRVDRPLDIHQHRWGHRGADTPADVPNQLPDRLPAAGRSAPSTFPERCRRTQATRVSASASIANRSLEAPQPMRWRYPAMTPTFCCGTGSRPPGVPDASSVSTLALAWRGCGGIAPNGSPDALVACRYALLCLQLVRSTERLSSRMKCD
jgi:hypothetical protein